MAGLNAGLGVTLGRLTLDDVDAAATLSRVIGWNQTEADWVRLVATPGSEVFAARSGDSLVGTASLVRYGSSLGWLGMVIVHPDVRGRGLGGALVDHVLAEWDAAPGTMLGLDATEFGAPLYQRRGFKNLATIDRWLGTATSVAEAALTASGSAAVTVRTVVASDGQPIADLDLRYAGVDRSGLLQRLIAESIDTPGAAGVRLIVAERDGALVGYAAVRPGRERSHVGPLIADGDEAVAALLTGLTSFSTGAEWYLDAVSQSGRTHVLRSLGFEVVRTLQRMARGERAMTTPVGADGGGVGSALALTGDRLVAAMGFEWG